MVRHSFGLMFGLVFFKNKSHYHRPHSGGMGKVMFSQVSERPQTSDWVYSPAPIGEFLSWVPFGPRMGEGNVFTGVCLSTEGGGTPVSGPRSFPGVSSGPRMGKVMFSQVCVCPHGGGGEVPQYLVPGVP